MRRDWRHLDETRDERRNARRETRTTRRDVIKQDDTGNVSGTTQPTQRNKHAFSLGEVTSSSRKKYRGV